MRSFHPLYALGAVLMASTTFAQRYTTTLPWADGNTIVVTVSTDPIAGIVTTQTLSTIGGGTTVAGGVLTTPTTTRTRTTAAVTTAVTTDANGDPITTTGQRVVGQQESVAPMRTTTYWYDPGSGVWTSAVWTASVTAAPTAVTAIVPEGTIANYETYQSAINKNVFASAEAANNAVASSNSKSGAVKNTANMGMWGWTGVVGAVGAGVLAVAL